MLPHLSSTQQTKLAQDTRVRFVADVSRVMVDLGGAVQERLVVLMGEVTTSREMQARRDAWQFYQKSRTPWVEGTITHWQDALKPPVAAPKQELDLGSLQLVGNEVVENKILASRLVLSVMEKVSSQLDDLRLRVKLLENRDELEGHDVLRLEVLLLHLVEQWAVSGMPGNVWPMVNDTVSRLLAERLREAYSRGNDFLIQQGVLPTIELKDRVKRVGGNAPGAPPARSHTGAEGAVSDIGASPTGRSGYDHSGSAAPHSTGGGAYSGGSGAGNVSGQGDGVGSPGVASSASPYGAQSSAGSARSGGAVGGGVAGQQQPSHAAPVYSGDVAQEETRMMTSTTPLSRARSRAQGVMGQLKRLLIGRADADFGTTSQPPASPALAAAIAHRPGPGKPQDAYVVTDTVMDDYTPAGVARVASQLRQHTNELKQKAETKNEKATIEIVALMFQAILQEERIPPAMRVWFARLQMPVLRVALEEPDFFGTLNHPARQLIDRLGSCVMGFDASGVQGGPLETEVKRVVQVIEQYPETGKRVFQLVYEEFQKFLAKFLTEKASTQKVVSVAQQVEQKETLTIQYTIEMRNMFTDVPMRDEIRTFLFKVWAEVLAVAAVRQGPQNAGTLEMKKTATDLVWAASAKPNRADRAKVIQELPALLQRLRAGMTMLGIPPSEQDTHIKSVSDTLADAFLSKTQAIPQAKIDAMAKRLAHLEDFVTEDGMGDLPLDADGIEMMLGIDASTIDVVAGGGSKPTPAMLAWAQELQLGSWFTLDHNGRVSQVQFAWRSERKHLNLFATTDGHSYLLQAGRLAAYLQAGLLLPQEEETLTVRATRTALAKIEANPERLLE
jgi:hypothetical protein